MVSMNKHILLDVFPDHPAQRTWPTYTLNTHAYRYTSLTFQAPKGPCKRNLFIYLISDLIIHLLIVRNFGYICNQNNVSLMLLQIQITDKQINR